MNVAALLLACSLGMGGTSEASGQSCMIPGRFPLRSGFMPFPTVAAPEPCGYSLGHAGPCRVGQSGSTAMDTPEPAKPGEAPFGLSWGPLTEVPKPSMVDREGNITALIYFHDRPPSTGRDTDRVVLEVCKDEGLQQVIWLSRPLSDAELQVRHAAILQEGVRRHGTPREGDAPGTVAWPAARIFLSVRTSASEERRLLMVSQGERYTGCSATHEAMTGHSAGVHASRLLNPESDGR
jgi:hypothetical protein